MKIYVGFKKEVKPEVFESDGEPGKEIQSKYDMIYGPFKSRQDAEKYVKAMGELACGDADV